MLNEMSTLEVVKLLSPIIVIELALVLYCVINIFRKGVRSLNKWAWLAIVILFNTLGPILYLLLGKKRWEDD